MSTSSMAEHPPRPLRRGRRRCDRARPARLRRLRCRPTVGPGRVHADAAPPHRPPMIELAHPTRRGFPWTSPPRSLALASTRPSRPAPSRTRSRAPSPTAAATSPGTWTRSGGAWSCSGRSGRRFAARRWRRHWPGASCGSCMRSLPSDRRPNEDRIVRSDAGHAAVPHRRGRPSREPAFSPKPLVARPRGPAALSPPRSRTPRGRAWPIRVGPVRRPHRRRGAAGGPAPCRPARRSRSAQSRRGGAAARTAPADRGSRRLARGSTCHRRSDRCGGR